jgi:hypothetical protein
MESLFSIFVIYYNLKLQIDNLIESALTKIWETVIIFSDLYLNCNLFLFFLLNFNKLHFTPNHLTFSFSLPPLILC